MITNPIWVVKTRVFGTSINDRAAYKGLWGEAAAACCSPRSLLTCADGLRGVYRAEGIYGLYRGSLLTLAGTANGSIQFATYEEIKRRRAEAKRKKVEAAGGEWKTEMEKLVSRDFIRRQGGCR